MALPRSTSSLERFRKVELLGHGGLSAVYLARDEELNRLVALKVMRGRRESSEWARSRLLFEAEVTAGLEHPGVVPVYAQGIDLEGQAYFAMRHVQGSDLESTGPCHREIRAPGERNRVLRRLVDRLVDVCYTVHFAHEQGIIHRDLTPSNIMLGRHGETLVLDWGLARFVGQSGPDVVDGSPGGSWPVSARALSDTRMGETVGTPRFMSPEQARGAWDRLGPATDVFGLGATLYWLLTGRAPFDDVDDRASTARAAVVDCPAPRALDRRVPAALEAICLGAMMPDTTDRYQSPIELADDLSRWVEGRALSVKRRAACLPWSTRPMAGTIAFPSKSTA